MNRPLGWICKNTLGYLYEVLDVTYLQPLLEPDSIPSEGVFSAVVFRHVM